MHVVATAGHVDHGKSTLVRAVTGMDPDRLAEEKERGLTIDLGFAWATLPSGRELAFVDVPGHARFVKNMLAGVGAVDACLFVVDATEGWKPQSEEHLRILDLLGVGHAVVALTRAAAAGGVADSPPSPTSGCPGKNGARCSATAIGPIPGPPPPWGIAKVLWRLRWHTSAPIDAGLVRPTCAFMFAPSM